MDLKKIIVLGGVGLASAAIGVLLPTMISSGHAEAVTSPAKESGHAAPSGHDKEKSGHDEKKEAAAKPDAHGGDHGKPEDTKKAPKVGPCFLPFGQMVVNLNEPMLIKFLSIDISIQTDGKYEDEVKAALEAKMPILKTWLTSHLADKTMEDIRGKVGVNRLRREIQDNFNSLLFKDGHERVQDIMFEEYHVQ